MVKIKMMIMIFLYRKCKAFVSVFYGKYIQSIEILMKPTMGFDYSCLNKAPD